MTEHQVRAAASMILALKALPDSERLDVLAIVAKCLIEPRPYQRLFGVSKGQRNV